MIIASGNERRLTVNYSVFSKPSRNWRVVVVVAAAAVSTAGTAQTSPVMVGVGNGAPLVGSSSSRVGVGVLTPKVNGNDNSIRLLGAEKTLGVSTTAIRGADGRNTEVQTHTPVDGVANRVLPPR
jgi:hypothetical protein